MFAFLDIVKPIAINSRLWNHKERKRQTPLDIVFSLTGLPPMHCAFSNLDTIKLDNVLSWSKATDFKESCIF